MSVHFGELAMKFGADGVISPGEVLALRREAWPDGHISQAEAEAIVALNHQLTSRCREWVEFYVEAWANMSSISVRRRAMSMPRTRHG